MRHLCLAAISGAFIATGAVADTVELTITGTWTAADFDVSHTDAAATPATRDDDLVFGFAPFDGSLSFTLVVDTATEVVYLPGPDPVTTPFYGYTGVTLKNPIVFGSATFETSGILTGLVGPNGATAALWTNADLDNASPTQLSFRVGGTFDGSGNADLFVGTRNAGPGGLSFGDQFLLWEYFGEEIRSSTFTAVSTGAPAVPLPAPALMLAGGLAGLGLIRRRGRRA